MSLERKQVRGYQQKVIGLCNRDKERGCTEKEESISIVKEREKRGVWAHWRTTKKIVYQTLKIASNSTSVLCRKKE